MEKKKNIPLRTRILYEGIVVCALIAFVWYVQQNRAVQAGSITPPASVTTTMNTAQDIYDAIASSTYDSSSITSTLSGSVLQVTKCLIDKVNGAPCP